MLPDAVDGRLRLEARRRGVPGGEVSASRSSESETAARLTPPSGSTNTSAGHSAGIAGPELFAVDAGLAGGGPLVVPALVVAEVAYSLAHGIGVEAEG
jgi:hypothetical protein